MFGLGLGMGLGLGQGVGVEGGGGVGGCGGGEWVGLVWVALVASRGEWALIGSDQESAGIAGTRLHIASDYISVVFAVFAAAVSEVLLQNAYRVACPQPLRHGAHRLAVGVLG